LLIKQENRANNRNFDTKDERTVALLKKDKSELLESGNEWYCSRCKKHQPAVKKVSFVFDHLPEILIISLKRFEFRDVSAIYNSNRPLNHRDKIDDLVGKIFIYLFIFI
jgi:ubiquitin C-terminal hydrolase